MSRSRAVLVLVCLVGGAVCQGHDPNYQISDATFEALKPRGLRVWIQAEPGIDLFAFHGNLNKKIVQPENGQLTAEVSREKNGRWTFEDPRVRLKAGDKVHYWLYVQFDGAGYTTTDLVWTYAGDGTSATVCGATNTTVRGKTSCAGALIFSEDFNTLDSTRWQYDVRMANSPDWEFVTYMNLAETSNIENGMLVLRPSLMDDIYNEVQYVNRGRLDLPSCTGKTGTEECVKQGTGGRNILPPIITTRVRTKNSFFFRYGRVEMRAKLPVGDWVFPELWLSPKDRSYGPDYTSGQIRLAFARGNENLNSRAGSHIGNKLLEAGCMLGVARAGRQPVVKRHLTSRTGTEAWSNTFRNYSLVWTPDEITFSVDGVQYSTVSPPAGGFKNFPEFASIPRNPWTGGTKMAPFDKEFYVRIGLGVGGIRAFPDNCVNGGRPKPWRNSDPKAMALFWRDKASWYPSWSNAELQVDSIKIWAL